MAASSQLSPEDRMPSGGCCPSGARRGLKPQELAATVEASRGAPAFQRAAVVIPGGLARVGTSAPVLRADGEAPQRRVRLRSFRMDVAAVSNGVFSRFVEATGYVTDAERFGWSFAFDPSPAPPERETLPGAPWWAKVHGACWRHPEGPGSSLAGRDGHPVVHVSFHDARAFAAWAGGRLPTEAEWEHAARGGLDDPRYPWGDQEPDDADFTPCNIFQGTFPRGNLGLDGYLTTAPGDAFEPNGYGLYNMVGNVWEWCADPFRVRSLRKAAAARGREAAADDQRVLKGGSYLCHASYCWRYRIAARTGSASDNSTGHTGFRLVYDR